MHYPKVYKFMDFASYSSFLSPIHNPAYNIQIQPHPTQFILQETWIIHGKARNYSPLQWAIKKQKNKKRKGFGLYTWLWRIDSRNLSKWMGELGGFWILKQLPKQVVSQCPDLQPTWSGVSSPRYLASNGYFPSLVRDFGKLSQRLVKMVWTFRFLKLRGTHSYV